MRQFAAAFLAGMMAAALATGAMAEPKHGIAMYGDPALPPDFVALPYADPDAPKGGRIIFGESGGFDSLNPWILKGSAPWGMRIHVAEAMMVRSIDEPFTLYGLLAESVETDPDRTWVEFTLREEARFSDGSPVTVEDVIWSYETLGTEGHPRYHTAWNKVESIAATGPRSVRITFNTADRELALLMGMRPILKKAQWQDTDFGESGLTVPIGSGAYVVDEFEPGRFISFRRDPDYWGADLPVNAGVNNLDEIRYEYFGDAGVVFEAFKAGEINIWAEWNAAKWETQYDFPAVRDGRIVKSTIPHRRPSGIRGFVMNTRLPVFADWRVREAMTLAFNFELVNQTLNDGTEPRITSYFSNSVLGMQDGPAEGRVAELLAPHEGDLVPGTIEGYALPVADGTEVNRGNMRKATRLLSQAGWSVDDAGVLRNEAGAAFVFEILLNQGATEIAAITDIYLESLKRLGMQVTVTQVDSAQYTERTKNYDFGMAYYNRALSLSPGNEQFLYWGRNGVTEPGTRNWMGVDSPAVEAMIGTMLEADSREDFISATRALDRLLTAGRYVIPFWFSREVRVAHARELRYPETVPAYGYWPGFIPEVWYWEE